MMSIFKNRIQKSNSRIINKQNVDLAYEDITFPFLVSFPRTGSHWLRMLMELYFDKPSLTRSFFYHEAKEFTCLHHHDIELQLFRQNVIYLYRDPIPTIYSQLVYHKEDTNNLHRIKYWSTLYGLHLEKYLINDDFTEKKTILTYGGLVSRMAEEFSKLTKHLDYSLDISKLQNVKLEVDKEKLKKKTKHDNQVVNLSKNYNNDREYFIEKHSNLVLDSIGRVNDKLTLIIQ